MNAWVDISKFYENEKKKHQGNYIVLESDIFDFEIWNNLFP